MANQEDYATLEALSAGERHLMSMLYAASQMSTHQLILIDEPETSLHLDWQEQLLTEMMAQQGERQIIVCTHSPMIGAEHEDRMLEVKLTLSSFEFPPRQTIDSLWASEAEDRIDAYERGKMKAISATEVFAKINQQ